MKQFWFSVTFIGVVLFLFRILFLPHGGSSANNILGEPLPKFTLPSLNAPGSYFNNQDFKGHPSLVVVFAAWCEPCRAEQSTLLKIQNEQVLPIYGIDFRDTPKEALQFIQKYGNPFKNIGLDLRGQTVMDLSISGTPETLLINANGKIIYRHPGVLTFEDWETELGPLVEKNS